MATTVRVHDETWERLNSQKGRGESMDDVIRDLLATQDECEGCEPE